MKYSTFTFNALAVAAALISADSFAQAIPPVRDANGNPVTAQTMNQQVRVMLPGGQMISIPDSPAEPWWKDTRVLSYDRYVFDPGHNAYRVYNDSDWAAYSGKWGGVAAGEDSRRPQTGQMDSATPATAPAAGGDANGIKWHDSRDTVQ